MKIWVFCTESISARVYQTSSNRELRLSSEVTAGPGERRRFCRFLADRIEGAFTGDPESRFLICGEPVLVSQVCQCLSDGVRMRMIGIIPESVAHWSLELLRQDTSARVEKWEAKHGQEAA